MLQSDYLSLVAAFHKLDRENRDVVTQSEFRALLESRFGLDLSEAEFGRMMTRVPLNDAGLVRVRLFGRDSRLVKKVTFGSKLILTTVHQCSNPWAVKYPDFLASFDAGRFDNKSLFDAKSEFTSASQFVTAKARTIEKLENIIRRKLNENVNAFEKKFTEVDQLNQGKSTQSRFWCNFSFRMANDWNFVPVVTEGRHPTACNSWRVSEIVASVQTQCKKYTRLARISTLLSVWSKHSGLS